MSVERFYVEDGEIKTFDGGRHVGPVFVRWEDYDKLLYLNQQMAGQQNDVEAELAKIKESIATVRSLFR